MTTPPPDAFGTAAWRALQALAQTLRGTNLRDLHARDAHRSTTLTVEAQALVADFSRQRIDAAVLDALASLADELGLRERIEAMYSGAPINQTEGRAVLHTALRRPRDGTLILDGRDLMPDVRVERDRMLDFAEGVRSGRIAGSAGLSFERVINIGIGGSDLGPAMAVQALHQFHGAAPGVEFVSNVDGCRLADLLEHADPLRTLFIVCSKTFTTLETLTNARTARAWLQGRLGEQAVPLHFAAVSVNSAAMDEFRIHPEYRFAMWDWVGGRYSLWSSIGVSLAIAIGREHFEAFLAGAHAMDEHFRNAPWRQNLPALFGLIGAWNIDLLQLPTVAVLPYDDRLARFPAYLQQLEMESNGKSVRLDGSPVRGETAAVIWGEPGNNAQHSFFQLLHQGTPRAALDFLLPVQSSCGQQAQQDFAIANCLAQAEAFAYGQTVEQIVAPPAVLPHKVHAGNRPSTLLLFERLDPGTLGKLIALYEHKVFVQSVVWGINAFDQWGVELGKKLCDGIVPLVRGGEAAPEQRSLGHSLRYVRRWRQAE